MLKALCVELHNQLLNADFQKSAPLYHYHLCFLEGRSEVIGEAESDKSGI